jgi:hypothetical protein
VTIDADGKLATIVGFFGDILDHSGANGEDAGGRRG